jgi:formylglycine-generating enzyme required for sulfatase activity
MAFSLSGRADLIRALARNDPVLTTAMADLLGYRETPLVERELVRSRSEAVSRSQTDRDAQADVPYEPADVPFWRLEHYEAVSLDPLPAPRVTRTATDPSWRRRPTAMPGFTPLAPKRVVLTRLRQVSAIHHSTNDIDDEAAVEQLSRGVLLADLPKRQCRVWGSEILIIKDRARRLTPYWQDQDFVIDVLRQIYPFSGVTVARLREGESEPVIQWPHPRRNQIAAPSPGAMVLVLGDLGCLATDGDVWRRFWLDWGRRLREQQNPAIALIPTPTQTIPPELTRLWTIARWDVSPTAIPDLTPQAVDTAVQRLLTLLSPTVRLEPGLLRAVRCLLPEGRRDAGLEARVWQDAAIASPHSIAATWNPELRKAHQLRFVAQPEPERQAVLNMMRAWRANLHAAVWFEEIVGLDEHSRRELIDAADVEDAEAFLNAFAKIARQSGDASASTQAWAARLVERLPATYDIQVREAVHDLYELVRAYLDDTWAPAWFDPAVLSPAGQTVHQVVLWQVADQLRLQVMEPSAPVDVHPVVRGSPLGMVQTASGEVIVVTGEAEVSGNDFWLGGQPPAWAWRWDSDVFGAWVSFRIDDVEQRLRWIPPGRFYMGSPEEEEGRFEWEGPRHEVHISRGYWLFDTPCTQALWQTVMGDNPSEFQGAERPVENVSWVDCQGFIEALNARLPGLGLRLPTEAQWEYACRAGTETARYAENLEAIAWYGANSGNETHPVKQLEPNAWGLYDMLGNVEEWCQDGERDYTEEVEVDPVVEPTDVVASRVIRGGGWSLSVQDVRAAYRYWDHPGYACGYFGFRCASSGEGQPARARETGREEQRKAEPTVTASRISAARPLHVHRTSNSAAKLPEGNRFYMRTDRDRLRFGQITLPPWASEIRRDRYGLWVKFEVEGVRQRLRWIPPGRFWMGASPDDRDALDWESPRHEVHLTRGYWLFDTPCTQALWQAVMGTNPSHFKGEERPVERVSWEDCQRFIERLNGQLPGLALSLPTEAQWEYACRAGTETARYAENLEAIAWYEGNSGSETHAVGQLQPNAWGLYDMLGNVDEWCYDGRRDYTETVQVDPVGPTEAGVLRIIRGGSWNASALSVRAAFHYWYPPGGASVYLGFRCASSG